LIRSLTIAALSSLFATSALAAPEAGQLSRSLSRAVSERFELPASATVRLVDVRIGNRQSYDVASTIEAVELTGRARLNGVLAAKVVVSGEETSAIVWVRFRTIVQVPVVTVTRDLERNHKLGREDLALTTRTITSNRPYYRLKDVMGRATKSALLRGVLLHVRNTKSSAAVKRGDRVGVLIRRGVVAIQTSGELLTSGGIGDRIRVRISSTGKTVSALVKGEGIVEVLR
jgi:flagella basal body P-ring formation protein FlgA